MISCRADLLNKLKGKLRDEASVVFYVDNDQIKTNPTSFKIIYDEKMISVFGRTFEMVFKDKAMMDSTGNTWEARVYSKKIDKPEDIQKVVDDAQYYADKANNQKTYCKDRLMGGSLQQIDERPAYRITFWVQAGECHPS